ncbi:hypothetical protein [Nonomuraea longicatena]
MSTEGAEHELAARRQERDRISADLLDLDTHTTFQLLKGASLRGATERAWNDARQAAARMWALFDRYAAVLDEAEAVRARRRTPGMAELSELTRLLGGPSVVLESARRPLEQRALGEADEAETLTLDQAVARMDIAFGVVTAAMQAVDSIWNPVLPRLRQAEGDLRAVAELQRELGESLRPGAVEGDLARLRANVVEDPIGTAPHTAELDRVGELVAAARADLERALAARRGYPERRERLLAAIEDVRHAEAQARLAYGRVVVKIALPPSAAPRERSAELAARLSGLDASGEGWLSRQRTLAALEGDSTRAAEQARAAATALLGLVARRDELRGRLLAVQAKAERTGRAEDERACALHERARALLWSAPCDLREAAAAVERYQHAITGGGR